MKHMWTPVLDAEAGAQKCRMRCGTVWLNGSVEPSGECVPSRMTRVGDMTNLERAFGVTQDVVDAWRQSVVDAEVAEAVAFAEVYGTIHQVPGVWD
jgi:hypothetical protein